MSAPQTNLETQEKRHWGPIAGITLALIVAAVAAVYFIAAPAVEADAADPDGTPEAVSEQSDDMDATSEAIAEDRDDDDDDDDGDADDD